MAALYPKNGNSSNSTDADIILLESSPRLITSRNLSASIPECDFTDKGRQKVETPNVLSDNFRNSIYDSHPSLSLLLSGLIAEIRFLNLFAPPKTEHGESKRFN